MPTIFEAKQRNLQTLVRRAETEYDRAKALAARQGMVVAVRHKCFISYHGADIDAVTAFVDQFSSVFIPRVVGASDSDHFKDPVNSQDEDYIKQQIASKYMSDSSVTIVFVGACAWARKYVDWEIASSLRNSEKNKRNGLMAITPSDRSENKLPERFAKNWKSKEPSYATYNYYPTTSSALRGWIEDAYQARTTRPGLVVQGGSLKTRNSSC